LTVRTARKAFPIPVAADATWVVPEQLPWDFIVVDEMSQLTRDMYTHICRAWLQSDRRALLLFTGDFQQLPLVNKSHEATNAKDSPYWNLATHCCLHSVSVRIKDPKLTNFLRRTRSYKPTLQAVNDLVAGKCTSLSSGLQAAVASFFQDLPQGLILRVTRKGVAEVNAAAMVLFSTTDTIEVACWDEDGAARDAFQFFEYICH
jgi:hypothetical protein